MADLFTAKHEHLGQAPAHISLLGDKAKRPESAQHIISFPGGAIEVTRTTAGEYWAHILVNRGWADSDQSGLSGARGEVVASRVDRHGCPLDEIHDARGIRQIAVLIRTDRQP